MNRSDQIGQLAAALARAQGQMRPAKKDRRNPHLGNAYATLDSIIEAVREPLSQNELAYSQPPVDIGADGSITIETVLLHSSGEWLSSSLAYRITEVGKGRSGLQEMGATIMYLRRYSLCSLVGITADEDNDGHQGDADDRRGTTNGNGSAATAPNPAGQRLAPAGGCKSCHAPEGKPHASTCKAPATAPAPSATPQQAAVNALAPPAQPQAASPAPTAEERRAQGAAWQLLRVDPDINLNAGDIVEGARLVGLIIGRAVPDLMQAPAADIRRAADEVNIRRMARGKLDLECARTGMGWSLEQVASILGRPIDHLAEVRAEEWDACRLRLISDFEAAQVAEADESEAAAQPPDHDPFADN